LRNRLDAIAAQIGARGQRILIVGGLTDPNLGPAESTSTEAEPDPESPARPKAE
jgi:hypothetical protein